MMAARAISVGRVPRHEVQLGGEGHVRNGSVGIEFQPHQDQLMWISPIHLRPWVSPVSG